MRTILILITGLLYSTLSNAEIKIIKTSDNVNLHTEIRGTGPYCLYIHGGPGSGSYWLQKYYGKELEKHFTMIYLDQRGVGRSSSPSDSNYTINRVTADFDEVRIALRISSWYTLGHSFGGILQMKYYQNYPTTISGMLMFNCTLNMKDSLSKSWIPKACEFTNAKMPSMPLNSPTTILSAFFDVLSTLQKNGSFWKMSCLNPEIEKKVNESYSEIPNWNNDFASNALSINEYWDDFSSHTSNVKVPVLFFYGTKDWSVGPQHYKLVKFPNALLVKCKTSHLAFLEHPIAVGKAIKKYRKLISQK